MAGFIQTGVLNKRAWLFVPMNEDKQISEPALLRLAREGDLDAFTRLFEPLRRKIWAVAWRLVGTDEAEDVVMDTYLKAWKALPGFDGRSALGTWLCRIARNRALDVLRSRAVWQRHTQPEGEVVDEIGQLPDASVPHPAAVAACAESAGVVRQALNQLSAEHRQTLLLRYADDLGYGEIAAATGVSIGTVMSRLFYAHRKMKKLLSRPELAALLKGDGP